LELERREQQWHSLMTTMDADQRSRMASDGVAFLTVEQLEKAYDTKAAGYPLLENLFTEIN
jgi:hypothetical protein